LAVFGSSWSKARPPTSTRVAPIRRIRFFEVDVRPALSSDLAAPQAGKREVPGMPIAVIGDAAQYGTYLIRGERP
jgi:hypothetical protein